MRNSDGSRPIHPARPVQSTRVVQLARFVRSLLVGGVASLADLLMLTTLVELGGLRPTQANLPALLVGAVIQFILSRGFVFQAGQGPLGRQLAGFVAVELGTLALNAATFHLAVTHSAIPYPVARALCQFAVYAGFSYPLWSRVFAARSPTKAATLSG